VEEKVVRPEVVITAIKSTGKENSRFFYSSEKIFLQTSAIPSHWITICFSLSFVSGSDRAHRKKRSIFTKTVSGINPFRFENLIEKSVF